MSSKQLKLRKTDLLILFSTNTKKHLQKAYITTLNSAIYEIPDFDSKKLKHLPQGKQVTISKKIFYPKDHNFGSFYKIFSSKDKKKVVGYVSEAEVVPQFIKNDKGKYVLNKYYRIAKRQIQTKKIPDDDLSIKTMQERTKLNSYKQETMEQEKKVRRRYLASKRLKTKYAGVSVQALNQMTCFGFNLNQDFYTRDLNSASHSYFYPELAIDLDIKTNIQRPLPNVLADLDISYPLLHSPQRRVSIYGLLGVNLHYQHAGITNYSPQLPIPLPSPKKL